MALSNELAKLFAKTTNDNKTTSTETTVHGTIVENDGSTFVKIDGSEVLTPVKTTASIKNGDRVTVMLKNHTAMVTGNITAPSASSSDVDRLASKVDQFEIVVADVVTTEELQAEVARIDTVVADNVTIHEKLTAMEADIDEITAGEVTTEQLNAVKADVAELETNKLDAATAEINYAKVTDLNAATADISELEADNVTIKQSLTALEAEVETLEANQIDTEYLNANYANIDFSNIGEAAMEKFYADSGLIKNVQIGDATITGELVGVTISGDLIKGNTIVAEKLVIKGEDGLYYKLNTDGITTEAEQTDYNSLNGSLIQAQSITATKISVDDLVAFDATIGGFNITEEAIYSSTKNSAISGVSGVYMDKYGQLNVGNGTSYLRYHYIPETGKMGLFVSADTILFGTNKKSIKDIEATSTTEGAPVLITDGADSNAIDISIDGEMSQTQYTGKNLLENTATTVTKNGGTFTVNADKSVTVKGTFTASTEFFIGNTTVKEGTYIINGSPANNGTYGLRLYNGASHVATDIGSGKAYTVTNETTLRSSIYIGNGATLNTTFYPMLRKADITDDTYEPYCGGITSPNPDYTQVIKATGDCGWFDGELVANQSTSDESGAIGANNGYVLSKNYIPCNSGDTVKVMYGEVARVIRVSFYDSEKAHISTSYILNVTEYEIVAPANAKYLLFSISNTNSNITPSTAKHITVTINGKYAAIIDSVGKNLLKNTAVSKTYNGITFTVNEDGSVTANGTATANAYLTVGTLQTEKGKRYKLNGCPSGSTYPTALNYSFYVNWVINSAYSQSIDNGTNTSSTITFDVETTMTCNVMIYSGTTVSNLTFYPMVRYYEIDDITYEPYKEQTTYIPLTEPLRGIGEVKDSIKKVDGLYGEGRKFTKIVLDGNAPLYNMNMLSSTVRIRFTIPNKNVGLALCTHLTNINHYSLDEEHFYLGGDYIYVFLNQSRLSSVDNVGVLAYLTENPIAVIYELAEETFTPFEDQTPFYRIKTFKDVTHISASDNANVKVTYYRNTDDGQNLANIKFLGDVIVEGSITSQQIDTEELFANIAHIGKLTIDENGILTSEFLHESLIEEGSLVDDYININYEYWAPSVNDYKVVSGKTTLGFEDMVFERTNGYTDPHLGWWVNDTAATDGFYIYDIKSDNTIIKYHTNGIQASQILQGYCEELNVSETQDISGSITFENASYSDEDGLKFISLWRIKSDTIMLHANTNNIDMFAMEGEVSIRADHVEIASDTLTMFGSATVGSIVTRAGADLDNKTDSAIGAGSSAKTVTLTIPSSFYQLTSYANRSYIMFNAPLLYTCTMAAAYGGYSILHTISGAINAGSSVSLISTSFTPTSGASSINYAPAPTLQSMSTADDNTITLVLSIPANGSVMSMSSEIKIS